MSELKETQYQRKKRLAAEKAAREAAAVNPFAQAEGINESAPEEESTEAQGPSIDARRDPGEYAPSEFAMPEGELPEDDWLDSIDTTTAVAQVGDTGYEPITDGCIFSLNYKDSNTVVIRPYPIMVSRETSVSVFGSITTLINDPSGEGEPIFQEISPRVKGGRDEVLNKMLSALKNDAAMKKAAVRTIDNKFIMGQILANKNNPETVGKFVLFRISYSLNKVMSEAGVYDNISTLIQPANNQAIVVNISYDESRDRKIEYMVNLQTYPFGGDKLVLTAGNTYATVGENVNAFRAWKAQFYAAFNEIRARYNELTTFEPSKFTPAAAEAVLAKFQERYQEVNTAMATSASTAAAAIAAGSDPHLSNPFAANSGSSAAGNPFVSNMAPDNPFAAAKPSAGGFGDL